MLLGLRKRADGGVKLIRWKTDYWLPAGGYSPDYYDDEAVGYNNDDSLSTKAVRIWPYKGLKSEIKSIKRTVPDTRPPE